MTARSFSTAEAAELIGIGYVRLHRWAEAGVLTPSVDDGGVRPRGGHRKPRRWSAGDVAGGRCLALLAELDVRHAGLWAAVAAEAARWRDRPPSAAWAVCDGERAFLVDRGRMLELMLEAGPRVVVDLGAALRPEPAEDDDLVAASF